MTTLITEELNPYRRIEFYTEPSNKFRVYTGSGKRARVLGHFDTLAEAMQARDEAEQKEKAAE